MIQPALCSLHTQELSSIIHQTEQSQTPLPLLLILYSLYLILYDLNVYYTGRREILLSFELSGYRRLKKLGKFIGNNLAAATPPLHLCAAGFSASKRVDYFKKLQLDKSDERPADQKKMKLSGSGSAKDHC